MTGRRSVLLALSLAAFFSTLFARLLLSPLVPGIIESLSSSKSAIGLALTGMWAAYSVAQYPAGALSDRYGEKRLVLVALVAIGGASLLIAASPSYAFFLVAAVLVGATAGLYPPAGSSLLTKRFERVGQALGFHVAGANIAGLVAPIAAAYVAVRYGWRAAPLLTVALVVPVFLLFWLLVRPTPPESTAALRSRFAPGSAVAIMARPPIAFTAVVGTVGAFAFGAIASFLPTFLIEFWGVSTPRAGTAFGVVYLFSAVTMPVVGRASDRANSDYAIATSFAAVATGLSLLLFARPVAPMLLGVVVVGTGISWAGALQSRYMAHLGDEERATGFGLIRGVTGLVGSTGSVVVGTLAEFSGWTTAYGLVVVLLALVILALLANRTVGPGW